MHLPFGTALQGLGSIFFFPERLLRSVPDTHQVLLHSMQAKSVPTLPEVLLLSDEYADLPALRSVPVRMIAYRSLNHSVPR